MPDNQDILTKDVLIHWLADVPDDANIAFEINEFGQLDFIERPLTYRSVY